MPDWREWTGHLAAYYEEILRAEAGRGASHLYDLRSVAKRGLLADLGDFGVDIERVMSGASVVMRVTQPRIQEEEHEELALDRRDPTGRGEEDVAVDSAMEDDDRDDFPPEAPGPQASSVSNILRISRKQKSGEHIRETLVGFPVIGVRVGNKRFSGPLLTWEVTPVHRAADEIVELRVNSGTPAVNALLISKIADGDQSRQLAEQLQAIVQAEDFSLDDVDPVLRSVGQLLFDGTRLEEFEPETTEPLVAFWKAVSSLSGNAAPLVLRRPILLNGSKSQPFLLSDLRSIASRDIVEGDSVLSQVVGDVPQEGDPEFDRLRLPYDDTADGGHPIWYPFVSNESQRAVAQAATRSKVLTVQGPPGTGKSQTIANLVCHLVTEGHSVLVTSHQRKAMEVLSGMLSSYEGVALSLLRGDKASLAKLKAQLSAIPDTVDDEVAESIEAAEAGLRENDEQLRRLTRRYMELSRNEHEAYPRFARYSELRSDDRIAPEDRLPEDADSEQVSAVIAEWADLFVSLEGDLERFEALFCSHPDGTRVSERTIYAQLLELVTLGASADAPVSADGQRIGLRVQDRVDALDELAFCAEYLGDYLPDIVRTALDLGLPVSEPGVLESWREAASAIRPEGMEGWAARLDSLRTSLEEIDVRVEDFDLAPITSDRRSFERDLQLVDLKGRNLLRWHLWPDVRKARARLGEAGFALRRGLLDEDLAEIRALLRWLDLDEEVRSVGVAVRKRLPALAPVEGWDGRAATAQRLLQLEKVVDLLRRVASVPHSRLTAVLGDDLSLHQLVTEAQIQSAFDGLREAERWIRQADTGAEFVEALSVPAPWDSKVHALGIAIRDGRHTEASRSALTELTELVERYPAFERLRDIEQQELAQLSATLDRVRAEYRDTGVMPPWLADASNAVEAHRLGVLLRGSLAADPDSLPEIAAQLKRGQEERRALIGALVRHKRALRAQQAMLKPTTRVPLLALRKLLSRKTMNTSLVNMRDQIDYRAVLAAFPCWIMTIDDATRVFPPEAGLFDYLIVDEASQCPQASAMPLAFRAKRMVVVGDKKQLKPSGARWMSGAVIEQLKVKHGISKHPKSPFLDGRDSILDLAEACSNSARMLDEHFRCDPAIIRWSNDRFYDNRLKIMTRLKSGRVATPLEVREVAAGDEDRQEKVNVGEARAIVDEIRRLIASGEARGRTIGVISLFREQAALLGSLIRQEFADDPELVDRHELVATTADGFQGDERDIILYSFRSGPSSHAGSITTIQREEERLNVAFTRAKERAVCFVSQPVPNFPKGAVLDFLQHAVKESNRVQNRDTESREPDHFDSEFERRVCHRLRDRGVEVTTQVSCGRYLIDLVVEDSEGRRLAVECDGEWKHDDLGQLRQEDYQRQDIIERAGWVVHRISGRQWLLNPEHEIEKVMETLSRQATRTVMRDLVSRDASASPAPVEPRPDDDARPEEEDDSRPEAIAEVGEPAEASSPWISESDLDPQVLFGLIRWITLQSSPEWEIYDRLDQIRAIRADDAPLTRDQADFVEKAIRWAVPQGFDPADPPAQDLRPRVLDRS